MKIRNIVQGEKKSPLVYDKSTQKWGYSQGYKGHVTHIAMAISLFSRPDCMWQRRRKLWKSPQFRIKHEFSTG